MRRYILTALSVLALAALSVLLGIRIAGASDPYRNFLPSISNGPAQPASVCDGSAPIFGHDVGSLSVIRDAEGDYIVAVQDRSDGSRIHIMRHVGQHLEELDDPALAQAFGTMPQFSAGEAKGGAVALVPNVVVGEPRRAYFTQREQDDTPNEGPYLVWCVEF